MVPAFRSVREDSANCKSVPRSLNKQAGLGKIQFTPSILSPSESQVICSESEAQTGDLQKVFSRT